MLRFVTGVWRNVGLSLLVLLVAGWAFAMWYVVTTDLTNTAVSPGSMEPIVVSVRKYDKGDDGETVGTGESLAFEIPRAYFVGGDQMSEGVQGSIEIAFDHRNLEPFPSYNYSEFYDAYVHSGILRDDRNVKAEVFSTEFDRPALVPRTRQAFLDRIQPRFEMLDESHCGLHLARRANEKEEDWFRHRHLSGETYRFDHRDTRPFPLDTAQHFIHEEPPGTFQTVIRCDPGIPRCIADTTYQQRWMLRVVYPARRFCDWRDFIDQSRALFDGFLVSATEPRPEYRR